MISVVALYNESINHNKLLVIDIYHINCGHGACERRSLTVQLVTLDLLAMTVYMKGTKYRQMHIIMCRSVAKEYLSRKHEMVVKHDITKLYTPSKACF